MDPQWKALSKRAISDAQAARFLQEFVRKHGASGVGSYGNPGSNSASNHLHNRDSSHFGYSSNIPQHTAGIPNVANPKGVAADARAVYQSVASAAAAANAAAAAASAKASPSTAVKSEGYSVSYGNGGR